MEVKSEKFAVQALSWFPKELQRLPFDALNSPLQNEHREFGGYGSFVVFNKSSTVCDASEEFETFFCVGRTGPTGASFGCGTKYFELYGLTVGDKLLLIMLAHVSHMYLVLFPEPHTHSSLQHPSQHLSQQFAQQVLLDLIQIWKACFSSSLEDWLSTFDTDTAAASTVTTIHTKDSVSSASCHERRNIRRFFTVNAN
jgi:hypothetical protein